MTTYTDDTSVWNDLEHEFAGAMTTLNRVSIITQGPAMEEDYLEAYYTWILEYGRGLEQEDYVEFVRAYAPELLKMVEVEQ